MNGIQLLESFLDCMNSQPMRYDQSRNLPPQYMQVSNASDIIRYRR